MENHRPSETTNTATRPYHPYDDQDQDQDYDYQNILNYLDNLHTSPPDFLLPEEESLIISQGPSFTDNLTYHAGLGYFSGCTLGALKGTLEGLRSVEQGESVKLRVTRVLNSGESCASRFGSSLGFLGFVYTCLEFGVAEKIRGTDDSLNCVIAGLGTGAIYKAAAGPRPAVIAGVIGGITAAAAVKGKQFFQRFLPN